MKLSIALIATASILFFLVSHRTFGLNPHDSELFRLFSGVSNTIAFFIPLTMLIFCLLTSALMFTILDEKYEPPKMVRIIGLSFVPVILNCVVCLAILYDISLGLTLEDMQGISLIAWGGFYIILAIFTKIEFEIDPLKAIVISIFPSLMVIIGKFLF